MIELVKMKIPAGVVAAATLILYALFLVVPTKLVAGICAVFYILFLWRQLSSLPQALIVSYAAFVPLSLGKFFPVSLVPATGIQLLDRPTGVSSDIAVTLREGIVFGMAALLLWDRFYKKLRYGFDRVAVGLFLLPLIYIGSSALVSVRPEISVLHALFWAEPFVLYIFVRRIGQRVPYALVLMSVAIALFCESVIVFAQNIKGMTLGVVIEDFPGYVPVDVSADAGLLARFGGTFAYANILAHYLVFSLFLLIPAVFSPRLLVRKIAAAALIIGVWAFIVTLSRSAWLSFWIGLLGFYLLIRHEKRIALYRDVRVMGIMAIPVTVLLCIILAWPRTVSTARTLTKWGSGEMRITTMQSAVPVIAAHPWFGVGLSMDVLALYERSLRLHIPLPSFTPEPVQNGFVRLLMEVGVVGMIPYLAALYFLGCMLWRRYRSAAGEQRLYLAGLMAACVAVAANAELQPLLPDVSFIVLLSALLTPVPRAGHSA